MAILAFIIYFLAAVLWGVFAANMQVKIHPGSTSWLIILVLLLDGIFWPISMLIAVYNLIKGHHDKYFMMSHKK